MKILHSADWHLCSPLSCRLGEEKAKERRAELLSGFADMTAYARENGIRAILLCGDIGDNGTLPYAVQDYLLDTMTAEETIRFFLISGNHDRMTQGTVGGIFTRGRRQLPRNLTVFGGEWETVRIGDAVTVSGCSFDGKTAASLPKLEKEDYNIVLLHGEIMESGEGTLGTDDIIPLTSLSEKNIDYLALGHYHSFRHGKLGRRGTWCYAGCPGGRGFDECGEKGFVVLNLEIPKDGKVSCSAEFVPFARRRLHRVEVDVTDIPAALHALEDAVMTAVKVIPSADLVRVVLCGSDAPEIVRDTAYLTTRLSGRFYYIEVTDERKTALDMDAFRGDISLRGEFVRRVLSSPLTEKEKAEVLRCGLSAFDGEARYL